MKISNSIYMWLEGLYLYEKKKKKKNLIFLLHQFFFYIKKFLFGTSSV